MAVEQQRILGIELQHSWRREVDTIGILWNHLVASFSVSNYRVWVASNLEFIRFTQPACRHFGCPKFAAREVSEHYFSRMFSRRVVILIGP